ncbi:hypothetical protein JAAARDRAFT_41831 [Jaapia argillacea MUCL 33604]|uniref:Uncharacterized protein n=1 Tax=Jaapia argillacea MUCL 33604 TaxID=933084 RepID=A0A067P7H5_9AGAM|nr:hypothetical protein JAAARDRAFT_41831 [Jaapia argillacea MUCL 33604]
MDVVLSESGQQYFKVHIYRQVRMRGCMYCDQSCDCKEKRKNGGAEQHVNGEIVATTSDE